MASDIFDDVEETLNEESPSEDKNFNDSELQDIMSEIEDLEKEFEEAEAASQEMTLQQKIDAELAMELEEINNAEIVTEVSPEEVEAVEEIAAIMNKVKKSPSSHSPASPSPTPLKKSEVGLNASGPMSLSLDFKIGEEAAKLVIDPVKGLVITMSGVELCINEDSGCTVEMENGMKFTIPLNSSVNSPKKKAA